MGEMLFTDYLFVFEAVSILLPSSPSSPPSLSRASATNPSGDAAEPPDTDTEGHHS